MFNIISLYHKNEKGEVIRENKTTLPQIELLREFAQELMKKLGIDIEIYIENNSIGFKDVEKWKKQARKIIETAKLYELYNMKKIEEFERNLFNKTDKEKLKEYYKEANQIAMVVFLFPEAIYKRLLRKFKAQGKLELFYEATLPEKENFFIRIAKQGLKNNFARVFGKEIKKQELKKKPKLNKLEYWNYDFLSEKDKKNIHVLNTLQYLLDEKNNYLSYLEEKLKKVSDKYSLNSKLIKLKDKYVIINQNSKLYFIDEKLYNYLKYNKIIYDYHITQKRLQEFEQLYKEGFLLKNGKENKSLHKQKRIIKPKLIVLNLTSKCNLRCPYCYNTNNILRNNVHYDLEIEKLKSVIKKVIQDTKYKRYTFVYHGGEPTLYFDKILELTDYIKELSKKFNFKPIFSMQTNGTLLNKERIEQLVKYKIGISISVDGPEKINKRSRKLNDTLSEILFNNLKYLKEKKIRYSILVTVNKANFEHVKEMLDFFEEIRPSSVRFNTLIYSEISKDIMLSVEEYKKFYLELFTQYLNGDYHFKLNNLIEWIEKIVIYDQDKRSMICSSFPCWAGRRMINILGNGNIYPCGELVIDKLKITFDEIMKNNLIDMIKDKFKPIINLDINKINGCKDCVFKNICTNGCLGRIYHFTGRFNKQSVYCEMYKSIIYFILENWDNQKIQEIVKKWKEN